MSNGVSGAVVILAFFIGITAATYLIGFLIIKLLKKTEKKDSTDEINADEGNQ